VNWKTNIFRGAESHLFGSVDKALIVKLNPEWKYLASLPQFPYLPFMLLIFRKAFFLVGLTLFVIYAHSQVVISTRDGARTNRPTGLGQTSPAPVDASYGPYLAGPGLPLHRVHRKNILERKAQKKSHFKLAPCASARPANTRHWTFPWAASSEPHFRDKSLRRKARMRRATAARNANVGWLSKWGD